VSVEPEASASCAEDSSAAKPEALDEAAVGGPRVDRACWQATIWSIRPITASRLISQTIVCVTRNLKAPLVVLRRAMERLLGSAELHLRLPDCVCVRLRLPDCACGIAVRST